jgi:hypothetical protein
VSLARQPRPLDRDKQTFRDDRLYIIACDDTYAPDQYFRAFEDDFLGTRLQIHVVPTKDNRCAALDVLDRIRDYEVEDDDQRWIFLDTDHYIKDTHLRSFSQAIQEAKNLGSHVALSKPCFEFWLLLHHLEPDEPRLGQVTNAKSATKLLQETLDGYNKYKLDPESFPLALVPRAMMSARQIDEKVEGGDIPQGNTSRVYLLWEQIIGNASLPQLPKELRELWSYVQSL